MSNTNKRIILIGGGGHCKSTIDVIHSTQQFEIVGVVDNSLPLSSKVLDFPVIGTDDDLEALSEKADLFLISVGQIKNHEIRTNLFNKLKELKLPLATVVSPKAHVSKYAQIGEGSVIMHNAVINADAKIGNNCIINTGAIVEHDAVIGDYCHISTGAIINGEVKVGPSTFVGSKVTTKQGISIGSKAIIGAGLTLLSDVEDGSFLKNTGGIT